MAKSNFSLTPHFPQLAWTSYPSSAPAVSPSSSPSSSRYSPKMIRTTAICSASGSWLLGPREEREWSTRSHSGHYGPRPSTTSALWFQGGYLVCALPHVGYLPLHPLSLIRLSLRLFHSPTILVYESITCTSIIGSTYAVYDEAYHAPTCAYALLSFPTCLPWLTYSLFLDVSW